MLHLALDQALNALAAPHITHIRLAVQVATLGAELENYQEALEIFESIARSYVDNNLLKYSAKGLLLNAGICQLCGELSTDRHPPYSTGFPTKTGQCCFCAVTASLKQSCCQGFGFDAIG